MIKARKPVEPVEAQPTDPAPPPPAPAGSVTTAEVPVDTLLSAVTPAVAPAPPPPAAVPVGSTFEALPSVPYLGGPRDRLPKPEDAIARFTATPEQMAAQLPPPRPAPEQPPVAGWLAAVSSTDIVRGQVALVGLSLTAGPALTAELVAERTRRAALAAEELARRVALACKGLPPAERVAAGQQAHVAMVREATASKDRARAALGAFLSLQEASGEAPAAVLAEVLLTALGEADVLSLRGRVEHLARTT